MLRAATPQLLDAVRDAAIGQAAQPVESERRARAVAHQPFAAEIVVACDGDVGVEVEPISLDGAALARGRLDAAARVLRVGTVAKGAHGAALHRDRGAGVERSLRARLLRCQR